MSVTELARDIPTPIWVTATTTLITSLALVFQSWRTARREDKRRVEDREERQRDRESEAQARQEERRYSLDDHWRSERKQAHQDLLEGSGAAADAMFFALNEAGRSWRLPRDRMGTESSEALAQAEKALAAVQLVGSSASVAHAVTLVGRLRVVYLALLDIRLNHPLDEAVPDEKVKKVRDRLTFDVHESREKYRESARADLGTSA